MNTKFKIGHLLITPGALKLVPPDVVRKSVLRHATGDWGEVGEEDATLNDWSLENGGCLLSAYQISSGETFWIITEADRLATTVLLPSEY